MNQRPLRVAKRAIDVALEAVPGSVVERVTAATAPLTRYSGRTQAGTAALASALAVLAQPPRARQRRPSRLTLDKVAAHVGQPVDVVQRWADEGLLGTPLDEGAWSSDVLDRATLTMPSAAWMQRGGKQGVHSEHLGHLLAEMQSLPRAHPSARW